MTSKWASRFIWIAVVNGSIAVFWTSFLVWPYLKPAPTMVLASGSAGTWLLFGYLLYLVVGVLGIATTALFYQHIEGSLGKAYRGLRNVLAAVHLVLMEVGTIGATSLLMYAGYIGGSALLPTAVGGGGMTPSQVHEILVNFIQPIFIFTLLAILGALSGGLGYVLSELEKQKS
jgi:hypothetical protein